jgi:hypothetical protein
MPQRVLPHCLCWAMQVSFIRTFYWLYSSGHVRWGYFRPQQISDRVFKFVVASRNVGFHIYNLRSFSCEQYKIYFNLWSNGGPNWVSEAEKFFKEEECQWSLVSHRKAKNSRSYAEVVSKGPLHTGANWVPLGTSRARHNWKPPHRTSVFQRISWLKKDMWIIAIGLLRQRTWIFRSPVKVQSEIGGAFKLRIPGPRGSNQ